jgi:hypothetical protein
MKRMETPKPVEENTKFDEKTSKFDQKTSLKRQNRIFFHFFGLGQKVSVGLEG